MNWWQRLTGRRGRGTIQDDVAAHLAERAEDLIESGLTESEARQQARREFGNATRHVEDSREVWRWRALDETGRSVRHALRSLRGNASTFGACLAVLGLSTGLFATAIVIADALVFRPIHLKETDRVVSLGGLSEPGLGWDAVDWWSQARSLEHLVKWDAGLAAVGAGSDSRNTVTAAVSPAFFDVLEGRAAIGRVIEPNDYQRDGPLAVVISDAVWNARFLRDPAALGTAIRVGGLDGVVVGVMPSSFNYPPHAEVWTLRRRAGEPRLGFLRATGSAWVGRLAAGQSVESAHSEVLSLLQRLNETQTPKTGVHYGTMIGVELLRESLARPVRSAVIALLWGTVVILVLALANAATLLLGHVLERRPEFAVRAALGATRRRVLLQLVLESIVIGGTAGLLGGVGGVALFLVARPELVPLSALLAGPGIPIAIVLVGFGTGGVLGLLAGLSPVMLTAVWNDWNLLKQRVADRGSRHGRRLRTALVVAQVAAAMVLVVSAGVALMTFLSMSQVSLGFDPSHVVAIRFSRPSDAAPTPDRLARQLVDERLAPAAANVMTIPMVDERGFLFVGAEHRTAARALRVGPGFFQAMGVPILQGRDFRAGDGNAVVVSRRLATAVWGTRSPIGEWLPVNAGSLEVIAVVDDICETVDADRPDAQLYEAMAPDAPGAGASGMSSMVIGCPGTVACDALTASLRSRIESGGGQVVLADTLAHVLDATLAGAEVRSVIAGAYGLLGFVLSVAGIYGLVRYVVVARTREISIRMALGASRRGVLRLIIGYSVRVSLVGIAIGTCLALPLTSLMRSLVYGVGLIDPLTYAAAACALFVGGLFAAVGPARRLIRADLRRILND